MKALVISLSLHNGYARQRLKMSVQANKKNKKSNCDDIKAVLSWFGPNEFSEKHTKYHGKQ